MNSAKLYAGVSQSTHPPDTHTRRWVTVRKPGSPTVGAWRESISASRHRLHLQAAQPSTDRCSGSFMKNKGEEEGGGRGTKGAEKGEIREKGASKKGVVS